MEAVTLLDDNAVAPEDWSTPLDSYEPCPGNVYDRLAGYELENTADWSPKILKMMETIYEAIEKSEFRHVHNFLNATKVHCSDGMM